MNLLTLRKLENCSDVDCLIIFLVDLSLYSKSFLPLTRSSAWHSLRHGNRYVEFRMYLGRNAHWGTFVQWHKRSKLEGKNSIYRSDFQNAACRGQSTVQSAAKTRNATIL